MEDDFEDAGFPSGSDAGSEPDEDSDEALPEATARMKGTLEQRRQARAAGSHPLQAAFRDTAASLLAKHGIRVSTVRRGICIWHARLLRIGMTCSSAFALLYPICSRLLCINRFTCLAA